MSTPQSPDSNIAGVLLDGIVDALTDRGSPTHARKEVRARDVWTLVSSFQPQDAMQMILVGQCLLFNELVADGGRDVMRGMMNTLKLRAQSNLNALNRSLHQNLDMLLRLRDESAAASAPREAARETTAPPKQRPEAVRKAPPPKSASVPAEPTRPEPSAIENPMPPEAAPDEATSWLDEPRTTWLIETPAEATARAAAEQASAGDAAPAPNDPPLARQDIAIECGTIEPEPAEPGAIESWGDEILARPVLAPTMTSADDAAVPELTGTA